MKLPSTFLLAALSGAALVSSGCTFVPCETLRQQAEPAETASSGEIREQPVPQRQTEAHGLWLPFGKPEAFLTTGQERALDAVREYEKHVLRTRKVDFHYEVSDATPGYEVVVHYGLGHVDNDPILPGASIVYLVDEKGQVQKRSMG